MLPATRYEIRTARLKRSPQASLRTMNVLSLDGRGEDASLDIAFGVLFVLPVNPQRRVNAQNHNGTSPVGLILERKDMTHNGIRLKTRSVGEDTDLRRRTCCTCGKPLCSVRVLSRRRRLRIFFSKLFPFSSDADRPEKNVRCTAGCSTSRSTSSRPIPCPSQDLRLQKVEKASSGIVQQPASSFVTIPQSQLSALGTSTCNTR